MNDKPSPQCGMEATQVSCPNDAGGCALSCADTCAALAGEYLPPIVFAEARARYEREAVHGVCDTGRYRMRYYSWGEGPPLLFVHGLGDSRLSFIQPISRLSAHFRCLAYDLPNGRDDGARLRRLGHDDLVADLWALLDHLQLRQSYVLGSSFGSTIVLKAMRTDPQRLPRGILQGGLAHRSLRRAERFLAYWCRFLPGRMAQVPLRAKILRHSAGAALSEARPDAWRHFLEHTGRTPVAMFASQAYALHRLDLRPLLSEIRQPVLLVCGERDRVVPRVHEEVLLQGLPNAGRVVLAGCGHIPSYTHPELLAEVVRRFLTPPQPGERIVNCAGK